MDLSNRVAVVTGGARGISAAVVSDLAEAHSHVWIADIDEKSGRELSGELRAKGLSVDFHQVDVTDRVSVERMTSHILKQEGHIDILFNGATPLNVHKYLFDFSEEEWDRTMGIHVKGTFLCSQAIGRQMVRAGYGRLITVSSWQTIGRVGYTAYAAAKGAINSFTKSLASELMRFNVDVTVNAIAPPGTDTRDQRHGRTAEEFEEIKKSGVLADPKEAAKLVRVLIGPESSEINGQIIYHRNNLNRLGIRLDSNFYSESSTPRFLLDTI